MTNDPYRPPNEPPAADATTLSNQRSGSRFLPSTAKAAFVWTLAVFPVLAVIDMFIDRIRGFGGWPNDLPAPLLLLGLVAGGALWFRGFYLWRPGPMSVSSIITALITLPLAYVASGLLSTPILIVGWYFATKRLF